MKTQLWRFIRPSAQALSLALASLTVAYSGQTPAPSLALVKMNAKEGIIYDEKSPVALLTSPGGVSVGIYAGGCGLSTQSIPNQFEQLLGQIDALLSPNSPAERAVANLDPSLQGKLLSWIQANQITVLIAPLGVGRETYSSFFIHQMPDLGKPAIVLDCSKDLRQYWGPSLAHELSHAWLYLRTQGDFPAWLDEMLAQLVENEAQGARPENALRRFRESLGKRQSQPLTLWDTNRPLQSSDSYSLSYLFGKYLLSRWGGWETLRAMLAAPRQPSPAANTDFADWSADYWEQMTQTGRESLQSRGFSPSLIEKMTPRGLLRFFAVAMVLHSESYPIYSIPGWPKLEEKSARPFPKNITLKPGQFWLAPLDSDSSFFPASSDTIEKYEIRYSETHFKITPWGAPVAAEPHGWDWLAKFVLLVNSK